MRIQLSSSQSNITQNFNPDKNKCLSFPNGVMQEKSQKKLKSGSSAAIVAVAAVSGVFVLSKGFQRGASIFLNNTKDFFEKKLAHSTLNESGKIKKFYRFSIRRINSFIEKSQSINNIVSLKDILFMKLMYKTKPTKEIHQSISNVFGNISRKTVLNSYEKTKKHFAVMNKTFDNLDEYILKNSADEKVIINGKEYTKRELVGVAKDKRELCNMLINAFIDKSTLENRYNYVNDIMSSLCSNFWDASFKDFWTKKNRFKRKEMWQTFIAAEQIKGDKTHIATWASYARNAITYTNKDQTINVLEYIKALDNIVPLKDKEGMDIIKRLEWFVKNPDIFANNKELFLKELNKLKEHKFLTGSESNIMQTLEKYKSANIELIERQINDNKPGMLQDMISYYYKIAPFELDKSGALNALKRAVKSFDKSVELEGVEFFDKLRDLKLGSAPTDVLTILFSFVTLTFGLGHAKDNDTRTSIVLKSGIPVVGGIAASMYSAAKLVSGGKSLALGFLSGIILNRLGVIADNLRKNKEYKFTSL